MRQPIVYTPSKIKEYNVTEFTGLHGWIPSRPMGHNLLSINHRWIMAWNVLIGNYDVLDWQDK